MTTLPHYISTRSNAGNTSISALFGCTEMCWNAMVVSPICHPAPPGGYCIDLVAVVTRRIHEGLLAPTPSSRSLMQAGRGLLSLAVQKVECLQLACRLPPIQGQPLPIHHLRPEYVCPTVYFEPLSLRQHSQRHQ